MFPILTLLVNVFLCVIIERAGQVGGPVKFLNYTKDTSSTLYHFPSDKAYTKKYARDSEIFFLQTGNKNFFKNN